jgi:hypothetical protein
MLSGKSAEGVQKAGMCMGGDVVRRVGRGSAKGRYV